MENILRRQEVKGLKCGSILQEMGLNELLMKREVGGGYRCRSMTISRGRFRGEPLSLCRTKIPAFDTIDKHQVHNSSP